MKKRKRNNLKTYKNLMKKFILSLITMVALVACNENNTPETPQPPVENKDFVITVDESQLSAYQVVFSVYPEDKSKIYYCDVMSKARWEETDVMDLVRELDAALLSFADMTGATYDEVVEQMLNKGDTVDFCSNSGYRGDTDFVIYAFYWDPYATVVKTTIAEFRTPTAVPSEQNITISFENVEPTTMNVKCEPTSGVKEYYYYFAETTKVNAMLAELEDDNAYISYQAMNVGVKYTGAATIEQTGLKAEVDYTAIIVLIDNAGNRRQVSAAQLTPKVEQNVRVESELFETLLGEWSGTQTVYDGFSEPTTSNFTVTIAQSVADYDYDYRGFNQLVAMIDGWNNIPYYGIQGLIEEGVEDPEDKFGPKWTLNIAEGDVVTIDGQARNSVIGWMFYGHCFMVSANADAAVIDRSSDLDVTLSEDGNTITISTPVAGCYPSLAYDFTGFGWMANFYGTSNITLTRN